jgi:hypothetical protein
MKLPNREEINVHDSLDERSACKNFLGKNLDEAEAMFRENFLHYQEDLMWMGPVAFQFYVLAAIRYIRGNKSKGDSDAISCFLGLLQFRLEWEPESLRPVAGELTQACKFVAEHFDRFYVDDEIDGDLRQEFEKMSRQLA